MSEQHIPNPGNGKGIPEERARLAFEARYCREDFEQIKKGLWPKEMEDKWAIEYEAPWLFFHRSWTGVCIYAVRFQTIGHEDVAVEAWANRCREEYREENAEYDSAMLSFLIDRMLLDKNVPFPRQSMQTEETPALLQHVYVGRVFEGSGISGAAESELSWWQRICSWCLRKK